VHAIVGLHLDGNLQLRRREPADRGRQRDTRGARRMGAKGNQVEVHSGKASVRRSMRCSG
jgi:hypothetical protein